MLVLKYLLLIAGVAMFVIAAGILTYDAYLLIAWQRRRLNLDPAAGAPGPAPALRWRTSVAFAMLAWAPLLVAAGIVIVPSGMAGVRVSQTKGTLAGTLYPGVHFVLPLIERVELFNTRDQLFTTGISEDSLAKGVAKGAPGRRHELSEKVQGTYHYVYGPYVEPVLRIEPGDIVVVETKDAFENKITSERDSPSKILNMPFVNPQNGPIAVEGAEKGDVLCVHIHSIKPRGPQPAGTTALLPEFGGLVGTSNTAMLNPPLPERVKKMEVTEQGIRFNAKITLPYEPFIGTLGVSPQIDRTRIKFLEALTQQGLVQKALEASMTLEERTILKLRYGVLQDDELTLRDIGEILHLSRERVRQIEQRAEAPSQF